MKKTLAVLAVAITAAVAVWTYHHPPVHSPGPILDNPIALDPGQPYHRPPIHLPDPILDNPLLWETRQPRHLTKVISASACTLVNGYTWNGPGVIATYGAVLMPAGDFIINPNAPNQGTVTSQTPPDTVLLFCDARLPADTVAFEYAELEYFAPAVYANTGPRLDSYLDARVPNVNGFVYSQTLPLGSCTGSLSQLYTGTNPVSLCATDGGQSFEPDAGAPGSWPGVGWSLFSIHFLITLPPSPNPSLPNVAYRVIVHYQAP